MDAPVAARRNAIDLTSERPFRLGAAHVDPLSREASFEGGTERLQPQNLKVLIALARSRGKVVTREELIDLCWDGRFIGDDVINRAISTLRQFAERAGGFAIETVPRAGYRLVETTRSRNRRLWVVGAAAAIVSAAAGIAFVEWRSPRDEAKEPTIAILPFNTASADLQERELASNARDQLAHSLSRTEFQVALVDKVLESGKSTPDFVASADVSGSSDRIVVGVHVTDTAHNIVVYSQRFEAARARAGDLPDQVGAQVAGSLGWTASLLMLERNHPADPAITAALFGTGGNYEEGRKVVAKLPNSPIAQISLAFGAAGELPLLPHDQRAEAATIGRRAAERARVLAPTFGENEILWCLYHSLGRMIECQDHLHAAMRYDPDSPWVTHFLGDHLKDVGRMDEALGFASSSWNRDPYQTGKIGLVLRMLEATGKSRDAERIFETAKRGWPNDTVMFWDRMYGILDRGDFDALAAFGKFAPPEVAADVEAARPVFEAVKAKNLGELRRACPVAQDPSFKRDLCMLALSRFGDNDDAIDIGLRTYADRIGRTPAEEEQLWLDSPRYNDSDILMGTGAASLRRDPRYVEIARRIGALAYWRSGRLPDFCRPPNQEPVCVHLRRAS